ncbi:MAG: tetratricopeptide repeat protein [Verrucomicrobiota bacterium]
MTIHRFLYRVKKWAQSWYETLVPQVDLPGPSFFRRFLYRAKKWVWRGHETLVPQINLPGASFFRRLRMRVVMGVKYFFSLELPDFTGTIGMPVVRWFKTRPYAILWSVLPAALSGLLLLVTGGICLQVWSPWETRVEYQAIVEQALSNKEFERARVASQRLASLGTVKDPYLYYLALSLEGLGRRQEAADVIGLLAPLSHPVLGLAHLRVAREMLQQTNISPQVLDKAITHLQHALSLDPDSLEANNMLGSIYLQSDRWDLAKGHLANAAENSPFAAVKYAAILLDKGETETAKSCAVGATRLFAKKFSQEKSFDVQRAWAMAMALTGDFEGALTRMQLAMNRSEDATYALAMGDIYLLWTQAVTRSRPDDFPTVIDLLQKGLRFAPNNSGLLNVLVKLSLRDDVKIEAARGLLNKMLAQGRSPDILHFLIGSAAWEKGDVALSKEHFQLAYQVSSSSAWVANNVAFLLAMGENPDLPRALAIINPLVEKYPNNFHFRDTRGHVQIKMGRWREGIADLEITLPKLDNPRPSHTALAQAYRALGMGDLASEHERLAHPVGTGAKDVVTGKN